MTKTRIRHYRFYISKTRKAKHRRNSVGANRVEPLCGSERLATKSIDDRRSSKDFGQHGGQGTKRKHNESKQIVLFLSAHGEQLYDQPFRNDNVKMLSFVTKYGELGNMLQRPFGETRQSLDEIALQHSGRCMKNRYRNQQSMYETLGTIAGELRPVYVRSLEQYPDLQEKYEKGFKIVEMSSDRTFYFEPNEGEDEEVHAHYGLHILDVQGLENDHPLNHFQASNRPDASVNDRKTYDYGNITYMSDQTIKTRVLDNYNRIADAMDKYILDEDIRKRCDTIYYSMMGMEPGSSAKLSDIVYLFEHLGFEHIYFIDPTCRDIDQEKGPIASRVAVRRGHQDIVEMNPTIMPFPDNIFSQQSPLQSSPWLPSPLQPSPLPITPQTGSMYGIVSSFFSHYLHKSRSQHLKKSRPKNTALEREMTTSRPRKRVRRPSKSRT